MITRLYGHVVRIKFEESVGPVMLFTLISQYLQLVLKIIEAVGKIIVTLLPDWIILDGIMVCPFTILFEVSLIYSSIEAVAFTLVNQAAKLYSLGKVIITSGALK